MATEVYTAEQVIAAIKGSAGIKENIRKRLGCQSRHTVDNYLRRYATAQQAYEDELEALGDAAESLVVSDIVSNRNVDTAKWYLTKKHRARGYGDKSEISHKIEDVSKLSDDELRAIVTAKGSSGA